MFGLIKGIFIGLLTGRVNGYNHTKWISVGNPRLNQLLLFYIIMNTVKKFTTIHFQLY